MEVVRSGAWVRALLRTSSPTRHLLETGRSWKAGAERRDVACNRCRRTWLTQKLYALRTACVFLSAAISKEASAVFAVLFGAIDTLTTMREESKALTQPRLVLVLLLVAFALVLALVMAPVPGPVGLPRLLQLERPPPKKQCEFALAVKTTYV